MALIQLGLLRSALCRSLLPAARSSLAECVRLPSAVPRSCWRDAVPVVPLTRHYANKKSKAKGKGQPGKVKINTELVHDILNLEEVKESMAAILLSLKEEYSRNLSLRTSPGALDHIVVTTANGKVPLKQLGQISVKSPQLIIVNMTGSPEVTAVAARALRESSLRLNPEVDGTIIRVPIPMVTREHRENLCKLAKEFSHKAKESLRKVRSGAISTLKKSKDGVSEDTLRLIEQHVQQMTDSFTADIDKQLAAKTKELLG
ncbi:ribosome-recycling factor, mitochondrial [Brienomyrus brachyistius]|uniref:ribosome-recycling factor, mitochondrial n=1 Tax=Brienomyrus brachyistius TaxID=42636 RepID=UPI0020B27089|nr:ribosome-recycling factor, mitochondrial [Brienomyrus brachyistius]